MINKRQQQKTTGGRKKRTAAPPTRKHSGREQTYTTTRQQLAAGDSHHRVSIKRPAGDVPTQTKHSGAARGRPQERANKTARGRSRRASFQRTPTKPPPQRGYRQLKGGIAIPPLADGNIRIIPIGGVEEIGKNMTVIETKDDIVIMDTGFQFSEEDTPGIDYILPNTAYLEERKSKIRGVIITHGHLDHIGGIPYIMGRIGNPPIYSRNFTNLMIQRRQEEFMHLPPLNIVTVEKNETLTLGSMRITFFGVTHSIPDALGAIIETPHGDIVYTGDLRLDHVGGVPSEMEEEVYAAFRDRNVLLLMTDSTNVENPGFSISERLVVENIEEIVRTTPNRLIISTFASQVERIINMLKVAEKYGKKVAIEGRSMKTNIEVIKLAKLLDINPTTLITTEEIKNYPDDRIIVFATGAQGEEFAALMRIANKTHKHIRLTSRDTILMSSSIIPGNERSVQKLKDNLSRQGAHIIHYKTSDIHASGHANHDELAWIHKKIKAKFFIPIHGYHYMLRVHADLARSLGMPAKNIVIPDNGIVIEIQDEGSKITVLPEKAPSDLVLVDGFSVGNVQEAVIRDRTMLAQDGMFVVIAIVDTKTGVVRKSPDIISRGFVYLRESQDLLRQARFITKRTIEETARGMKPINFDDLRRQVTDDVGRFLLQQTAKRPMVLPVLIGV